MAVGVKAVCVSDLERQVIRIDVRPVVDSSSACKDWKSIVGALVRRG
jgi:hypothetical protein